MKKVLLSIILMVFTLIFVGCETGFTCSFIIESNDENINIVVDEEIYNSYEFYIDELNRGFSDNYSNIEFTSEEIDWYHGHMKHNFKLSSSTSDTCNLSLKLLEANKYVVDYLRIGILVNGELKVYKYYEKYEHIYNKEDDPDTLLHFESKTEIFNNIEIDFSTNETKEIVVFIWTEEAELYDKNGNRYTGWKDHSFDANYIELIMEVK